MLYGFDPSQVVSTQPIKPPTVNEAGEKILYGAAQVGREIVSDEKGGVRVVEHRVPGGSWEKSFMQDATFADGSVRKGGVFYAQRAIPEAGYEERKPFVPSDVEVQAPRVGAAGALNRTLTQGELDTQKDADDPHFDRKKSPTWPFMYAYGVK